LDFILYAEFIRGKLRFTIIKIILEVIRMLDTIIDNSRSDKNTVHSYLATYDKLFAPKRITAKRVMEIGIYNGGSIKLWRDYFLNATVHGVDIIQPDQIWPVLKEDPRIVIHAGKDAYNNAFFKSTFLDPGIKFDMILDDGPHTLESMKQYILLYSQVLTEDGILVIEDIQSIHWIPELSRTVPKDLQKYIQVFDLRKNKGRYDDIIFAINKTS
jgi:hypothetical protein